jgi:hypothetical protein
MDCVFEENIYNNTLYSTMNEIKDGLNKNQILFSDDLLFYLLNNPIFEMEKNLKILQIFLLEKNLDVLKNEIFSQIVIYYTSGIELDYFSSSLMKYNLTQEILDIYISKNVSIFEFIKVLINTPPPLQFKDITNVLFV